MQVSVILSTYNAPQWLEKAIWGYRVQTHADFEILVADDGSASDTARLLLRLRRETGLAIRHVWHEDDGFRKCAILNRAIERASTDYLVFSDGDCIPRRDFLATHVRHAEPRCFLSGGIVRLPMQLSRRITVEDVVSGRATRFGWLIRHGMPVSKKLLMLAPSGRVGASLDRLTTTRATWNGHNASGWRDDILQANGFDERMEYGGEDRELGERLMNADVRSKQIRHQAICVHLEHDRGYVRAEALQRNAMIRRETRLTQRVWTDFGIRQDRRLETIPGPAPGRTRRYETGPRKAA